MKNFKKVQNEKAITVVALVITIIILMILAGISVATLTGENGLFSRAKQAKEEHMNAQAKEDLTRKLYDILLDKQGEKSLEFLNGMTIDGYETQVSNISRMITMKKGNTTYNFLVDSEYNIQSLNSIQGITQNPGSGTGDNSNSLNSELINDFNIKIESQSGLIAKVNIDGEISTKDDSAILGYAILVNGQAVANTITMPYSIKLNEKSTTYNVSVIAIDIYVKTKKANNNISVTTPDVEVTPLDYPRMTANGMVNAKYKNLENNEDVYILDLNIDCTAPDALDKAAYDGDATTYYDGTSEKCKFYYESNTNPYYTCFNVDSNFKGNIVEYLSGPGYWNIPSDGKFLSNNIFHITYYGKNTVWNNYIFLEITGKLYEIFYDENIP